MPTEDRTPDHDEAAVPSAPNGMSDSSEKIDPIDDVECTLPAPIQETVEDSIDGAAEPGSQNVTQIEESRSPADAASTESEPVEKDRFDLVENFARGGLGKIWVANDGRIRREVAFKELLPKALKSSLTVSRFIEEAQITGQLEHPGIVPIYELGFQANGTPYYAMKLVRGETYEDAIAAYHALSPDDPDRYLVFTRLLRNFIDICNTLAFAHEHNVIHRDLKPHNVMLGQFGETLVLDWGLAKVIAASVDSSTATTEASSEATDTEQLASAEVESHQSDDASEVTEAIGDEMTIVADQSSYTGQEESLQRTRASLSESLSDSGTVRREVSVNERQSGTATQDGSVLGTPAYMAPEQARGEHDSLDGRADIYSLGAILYRLLANTTPLGKGSVRKIVKRAIAGDFKPPRQHDPSISKALEAICLKAMQKEPSDRYASALDLKADVEAWLADEPVAAFPDPLLLRMRRWIRRYRTTVLSTVAVLMTATIVPYAIQTVRHDRLTKAVTDRINDVEAVLVNEDYSSAMKLLDEAAGQVAQEPALEELAGQIERRRNDVMAKLSERELELEKARRSEAERARHIAEVNYERAERERKRANKNFVIASARRLVAESKAVRQSHPRQSMLLSIEAVELSRRRQETIVPEALQNLHEVAATFGGVGMFGHTDQILDSAIEFHGRMLLTGSKDRTARLWDFTTNDSTELTGHEGAINCVALPAGDRWAVTAGDDADVVVWDLNAPDINDSPIVLEGHELPVTCMAASPDGQWLATSGVDTDIRLWNLAANDIEKSVRLLKGHEDTVNQLMFSASGNQLFSAGESGAVLVWPVDLEADSPTTSTEAVVAEHRLKKHTSAVVSLAASPSGNWLVSGDAQGSVFACNLKSENLAESFPLSGHRRAVTEIAFPQSTAKTSDPSGTIGRLATAGMHGNIIVWQLTDNGPRMITEFLDHQGAVNDLIWVSPTVLISAGDDRTVRRFQVTEDSASSERSVTTLRAHEDAVWSLVSGGDYLISGSLDGAVQKWDLTREEPGMVPVVLRSHRRSIRNISGSHFGSDTLLLSSDRDQNWSFWTVNAARRLSRTGTSELYETVPRATAIARHYSSDQAAVAGGDGTILLLNSIDGKVSSVEVKGNGDGFNAMSFSADGRQLVAIGNEGTLGIVDVPLPSLEPGQQASVVKSVKLGESDLVVLAATGAPLSQCAIGTEDGGVILWSSGDEWRSLPGSHRDSVSGIVFGHGGSLLASISDDRSVRVWKRSEDGRFNDSPMVLVKHEERIRDAAFTMDGKSLLTVSDDATAILWPLTAEDPEDNATVLIGHESAIHACVLTTDGRWAITGSDDGTVRMWDLLSGNPSASVVVLNHFDEPVRALDVMDESKTLVIGTRAGEVFVWPLSPNELLHKVGRSAGRLLSPEEIQQFKTNTGDLGEDSPQPDVGDEQPE